MNQYEVMGIVGLVVVVVLVVMMIRARRGRREDPGVRLGMSQMQVEGMLGPPLEARQSTFGETWVYKELIVAFQGGEVVGYKPPRGSGGWCCLGCVLLALIPIGVALGIIWLIVRVMQ